MATKEERARNLIASLAGDALQLERYAYKLVDSLADCRRELAEMERRAASAELRLMGVYTPLWEFGYDPQDYEAQAIIGEALAERARLQELFTVTAANEKGVAATQNTLKRLIEAWEALPGGRHYSPRRIARWLLEDMKPAFDAARATEDTDGGS